VWQPFVQYRIQITARVKEAERADLLIGDGVITPMLAVEKATNLFGGKAQRLARDSSAWPMKGVSA
jgi:hypothetical protein